MSGTEEVTVSGSTHEENDATLIKSVDSKLSHILSSTDMSVTGISTSCEVSDDGKKKYFVKTSLKEKETSDTTNDSPFWKSIEFWIVGVLLLVLLVLCVISCLPIRSNIVISGPCTVRLSPGNVTIEFKGK